MYDNKYYQQNKCNDCIFMQSCAGIKDAAVRASCTARRPVGEAPIWGEMSYYRLRLLNDRSWIQRFRDGVSE